MTVPRYKLVLAMGGSVALLGLLAVAAGAQGRRGGFFMMGPGGGGLGLLRNKSVQTELRMTQPQIDKIDAKMQEMRQQMQQAFQNGQNDPASRQEAFRHMQQMQAQAVADILDNVQQHRFRQIELQTQGLAAIGRPDVARELALSAAQQSEVRTIQQEQMSQMRSLMQGVDFRNATDAQRTQMRQQMESLRNAAEQKYGSVLTHEQAARWKHMLGAAFKFVPGPPMRMRAGGGGGGG